MELIEDEDIVEQID